MAIEILEHDFDIALLKFSSDGKSVRDAERTKSPKYEPRLLSNYPKDQSAKKRTNPQNTPQP
jgi:hypothetical protein